MLTFPSTRSGKIGAEGGGTEMIVVAVPEFDDIAMVLCKAMVEEKHVVAETLDDALDAVAEHKPILVLLSVRLGGSSRRAVEWIHAMKSERTAIAVLSHEPTRQEVAEAVEFGAYAVVDVDSKSARSKLRDVIAAAIARRVHLEKSQKSSPRPGPSRSYRGRGRTAR